MKESGYDAIVIGAGISGLGVSALLAKDGMRVLTLEKGREIGGRAYSFRQRGHITNMGGPRAGLENGRVDALFAELGCEPGERGFFDDVKTFRDGELIDLTGLAMRGDVAQAGKMMHAAREIVESGHTINMAPEALVHHTHNYSTRSLLRRCSSEGYGWRTLNEPYAFSDMAGDMAHGATLRDLASGIRHRRIRTTAELLFPWLRPMALYWGSRFAKDVKL